MTEKNAAKVHARRGRFAAMPTTAAGALARELRRIAEQHTGITWPSVRYQADPAGFVRDVLGLTLWSRQIEILNAVRDHQRVSVRSGHKIGKSMTIACLALWFYCSFPDARVILSSTTSRQVDAILWREVRKILRSKHLKVPIDGEVHELARSGMKADDFREITGFTAREPEAIAGTSGGALFYLLDEASGIPDDIFDAIEGNRASGSARLAMFSNPTKTTGEFFESHTRKSNVYHAISVSSEEVPLAFPDGDTPPGLASQSWIDEKREEYGVDSAWYRVRVLGEFVQNEQGKILSIEAITISQTLWHVTPATGPLVIGLDPAGPGGKGDESGFACRRGKRLERIEGKRGLTPEAHLTHVLGLILEARVPPECGRPLVVIDRDGEVGAKVWGVFVAYLHSYGEGEGPFDLLGVRSGERATRQPEIYDRTRDELAAAMVAWFRDGGSIPEDARLEKELHLPEWKSNVTNRLKVTPKDEIRAQLDGRSPDRSDALQLSCWAPSNYEARIADDLRVLQAAPREEEERIPAMDPYAGGDAFRSR